MNIPQLHTVVMEALRACAWLFLLGLIFLPLEFMFSQTARDQSRGSLLSDLGFYAVSAFVPQLLLAFPLGIASFLAYRVVPSGLHAAVASWPLWLRGLAAFVVADLGFYWGHRLAHQVPFLWRFHVIHHAPEHVYFLTSSRAHPVDNAFIRLCGLVPIYVLGLGAPQSVEGTLVATLLMLAVTIWGFFIHANVRWRLGPFEWLLATPAFHRWHHVRGEPRDRNFASMLPIWDRLFGTHHLPRGEWPEAYGIDQALPSSVVGQLLHPFVGARGQDPVQAPAPTTVR